MPKSQPRIDPVYEKLDEIQRLLVLLLVKLGTKQPEIASSPPRESIHC